MYTMRSRLGWFVKGLPYNCRFRESIKQLTTESEALDLINSYQKDLTGFFFETVIDLSFKLNRVSDLNVFSGYDFTRGKFIFHLCDPDLSDFSPG
jgi:hypothetical protein